jgi:TatD DNase family protein
MSKYIDAHCHTGQTSTVDAIVNAATILDWGRVVELSKAGMYGAVGVHPWYLNDLPDNWYAILREMLIQNPELHVGEIGLDKHKPDMDLQISVFERQLNLAHQFNRGVVLHCVGKWDVVLQILKMFRNKLPRFILAHGYTGPIPQMQKFADEYNMYFSYGPRDIRNSSRILATPLGRILAETDSDNPLGVINIVNKIADILNVDRDEMADIIYNNTIRMLKND